MRKGVFGPLVIGAEAAAQEQVDVSKGVDYFGPLVIGPSEPEKPKGVMVPSAALAAPTAPAAPAPKENAQLSLDKLKEALDNAFSTDSYIEMEFARAEGPRKGALRLLVEKERSNVTHEADGDVPARPDVIARLEAALKPAATVTA